MSFACCDRTTRAYVDESFRNNRGGSGMYLFGAVLVSQGEEEAIRRALRLNLPRSLARFHWHNDSRSVRMIATQTLAATPTGMTVLFTADIPAQKSERYRQHALWELVVQLEHRCGHDIVFESRERTQNQRDEETLESILESGAGGEFSYRFALPLDEPLLWLPDTLLGVAGMKLAHDEREYWDILGRKPDVVEIPPPHPKI